MDTVNKIKIHLGESESEKKEVSKFHFLCPFPFSESAFLNYFALA